MIYWVLQEELGYSYGVDEAPLNAIQFDNEKNQLKAIEKAEAETKSAFEEFFAPIKVEGNNESKELQLFRFLATQGRTDEEISSTMSKNELKIAAREVGAKVSGKEIELIERIKERLLL